MGENNKRPTAKIINPGLGDIEKVRDILFGKYVSSFEQQFSELEQRLEVDVDLLKERLTDKITEMDEMVNVSIAKLDKQINDKISVVGVSISEMDETVQLSIKKLDQQIIDEQKNRDRELGELQVSLSEAETTLQHSINLMEDQANQDLSSIKAIMQRSQEELESDKVGRDSLALMLDEVAIKLRSKK